MSALELNGLVKHFGSVVAVDGLDLEVNEGEFFALLGPSASGKTTTFRTICGIEKADHGRVFLFGKDVTDTDMRDRDVAMVFQTFALYPHLSIFENLAFPLREQRLGRDEIKRRIGEVSELLKLTHALDRKPGTASGGEQQRIAIGRALIREPRLLLLDEPLTNLDAKLRHDMRAEFKRIHREKGITIVYATPDDLEAMTMGDRVGVLKDGKLAQVATPDTLYDSPRDTYVAGMVGSPRMNLLDCTLSGGGTDARVVVPFGEYKSRLKSTALDGITSGTNLVFGIRPHEIHPCVPGYDGNDRFDATIHLVEPLGDLVVFDIVAGETQMKMVLPEEKAVAYREGDQLSCRFDLESTHLFSRETGERIV